MRVTAEWMDAIPLQAQTVILSALRGPDGVRKHHPCKGVQRAFRASVVKGGAYGRFLTTEDEGDNFMRMPILDQFQGNVDDFFKAVDELPGHYVIHLSHAAQCLAKWHPDPDTSEMWLRFYLRWCDELHIQPEGAASLEARLNDFGNHPWPEKNEEESADPYSHDALNDLTIEQLLCLRMRLETVMTGQKIERLFPKTTLEFNPVVRFGEVAVDLRKVSAVKRSGQRSVKVVVEGRPLLETCQSALDASELYQQISNAWIMANTTAARVDA